MTLQTSYDVSTLEPGAMGTTDTGEAKLQTIVVGPVAAFESMKMLGTNGGGFYGMNSAHPFENPTGLSNFFNTFAMMMFPVCPGIDVWPNAEQVPALPRDFCRHVCHDGRHNRLVGLFRYAETQSGTNRTSGGTKVRNPQCGISGWKAHGDYAGSSEPSRRAASGQSRGQGDAFRDFGRAQLLMP